MLYGLTSEISRELEDLLLQVLVKSEAESVFLCDEAGTVWAHRSLNESPQEANVAALCSASFFATREIARLVGEPEFKRVVHQGENKGLYMQSSSSDHLMVVIFDKQTNAGLVRLFTEELMGSIEDCLQRAGEQQGEETFRNASVEFNSEGPVFEVSPISETG